MQYFQTFKGYNQISFLMKLIQKSQFKINHYSKLSHTVNEINNLKIQYGS